MLQRIYAHNFRCLENFEFSLDGCSSALLIGKNGSGKSTLLEVLKIFQAIGGGETEVEKLVKSEDFFLGHSTAPVRFELEAQLDSHAFKYTLALELPENFYKLRIQEEQLVIDGEILFSRKQAQITLHRDSRQQFAAQFGMDWHRVALSVIQVPIPALDTFRNWLADMVLLAPIPQLMSEEAKNGHTGKLDENAANWSDWLSALLTRRPAAYTEISKYLSVIFPDFEELRFKPTSKESTSIQVCFRHAGNQIILPFKALSDGEKCFFLCAAVLAANRFDGPRFTFWDEPDSHLSIDEVSQFVLHLRRAFQQTGQIVMTSHNSEAIRRFSDNNTWVMGRRSHLEPSVIRRLQDLELKSDLIQKLIDGDIEP
ncbi:chromosome segregation protein SMC [Betaproteobacteria bacterium]|nr:chromosome segregation protein SMC [Betaproteobacteria bacterium]